MEVVTPTLYMIAGFGVYAAVQNFARGMTTPRSSSHLLLAAMCVGLVFASIFQAHAVHATSPERWTAANREAIDAALCAAVLLPWFLSDYSGIRPLSVLLALTALYVVSVISNTLLPFGVQLQHIDALYQLELPWGETITRARGPAGPWALSPSLAYGGTTVFGVYALLAAQRRSPKPGAWWMLAAVGVFFLGGIQAILVRLQLLHSIELGAIGFAVMFLMMGVTLSRETKSRLRSTESKYHSLFENSPDAILALDARGERVLEANETALQLLGYTKDELLTKSISDLNRPEDVAESRKRFDRVADGSIERMRFDARYRRADGCVGLADCSVAALKDEEGRITRLLLSAIDITERRQTEESLRESEMRLRGVIEQSPVPIAFTRDGINVDVNTVYLQTFGYQSTDELVGRSLLEQVAPQYRAQAEHRIRRRAEGAAVEDSYEMVGLRKDGTEFPISVTAKRLQFADGALTVAFVLDVTRQKAAEEEIKRLAFYDHLTGLANRQLINDRIRRALAHGARDTRHSALLLIDLDDFKMVNDTLGHVAGDALLQEIARRLTAVVRQVDSVARLGGDEFVVLLEDLSDRQPDAAGKAEIIGEKILGLLSEPYQLEGKSLYCTCSIGVALFTDRGLKPEDVIRQADIAMYEAKDQGRNVLRFFDPRMQDMINSRVQLERDLHAALDQRQFVLHYQMQVDSAFKPTGAEALIRWIHPERGLVSPAEFIPLSEETGLIDVIGQWVLDSACLQLERWRANSHTRELVLAINVSSKQLRRADFFEQVRDAVRRYGVEATQLQLELTESMLVDDIEETIATMNELKSFGVRFSLDDFGTGYSSLQYLKRLPLDQIKIAHSFVRDIAVDPNDHAIVRTVIAMARTLNFDVIAEGVETAQQRQLLLEAGCTRYQGYLFGRPVAAEAFEDSLKRR